MYLARSTDGVHYAAPQKSGMGTWKIEACPMDGGGLAIDHGQPVAAWRRDKDVFLTRYGQAELRIGTGHDIAVVSGSKGVYVAWTGEHGLEIFKPGAAKPMPLSPVGAFVNLVVLPSGGVLAAWEFNGAIHTARVEP